MDIKNDLIIKGDSLFDSIRHINEYGQEYWSARELMPLLEYAQWRRFNETIERAKDSCQSSGNKVSLHFANAGKSSPMSNGGYREVEDYHLSRYACYLVAMNGDPRKNNNKGAAAHGCKKDCIRLCHWRSVHKNQSIKKPPIVRRLFPRQLSFRYFARRFEYIRISYDGKEELSWTRNGIKSLYLCG